MTKKYELTDETIKIPDGTTLYRIRALRDFSDVHAGAFGGYVRRENNLSQEGNAWVYSDAEIKCVVDLICISGIGSVGRPTTVYRTKGGDIEVVCGCFTGNLDEFSEKIRKTHGDSKYAREYLAFVELIKIHFEIK